MTNHKNVYCLLLGGAIFMSSFGNGVATAADCIAVHDAIQNERVLMKKMALAEAALETCPKDPDIAYQNGYILERLRKYEEALSSYEKAISIDAGYAKAYFSMGDIYALQKNYEKAVEAYKNGLRHEPEDARAKSSLADILVQYKGGGAKDANITTVSAGPVVANKKAEDTVKTAAEKPPAYAVAPITRLVIPFHEKTTSLSQEAQDVLSVVVGQAMNRDDMRNSKFEIGGHTDNVGGVDRNHDISMQRAVAVQKYLVDNFDISADRLKVVAHGQKKPKVANDTPAGREANRRVEFSRVD